VAELGAPVPLKYNFPDRKSKKVIEGCKELDANQGILAAQSAKVG
jgi:hypothetical protein